MRLTQHSGQRAAGVRALNVEVFFDREVTSFLRQILLHGVSM